MAAVRVYLGTYRRNALLRRALDSLLAQTFTDWACELHNDDPADPYPTRLAREVGDPRIVPVDHAENLGPTRTFNLFFRGGVAERYVSILEDDNWWDPDFLQVMVREMDRRPDVALGWANMRLWEEQADGSWRDTGRCVWPEETSPLLFDWPHPRQARGAVHSNGAMLVRADRAGELRIPDEVPFAVIEGVRERLVRYPMLLVPRPLGNFAVTRSTSRGDDRALWGQCQALLAASFFAHVRLAPEAARDVWSEARAATPPATGPLITAGLIERRARHLLGYARPRDWVRFLAGLIRRPATNWRVLRAKAALPRTWATLDAGTRGLQDRAGRPERFAYPRPAPEPTPQAAAAR